MTAEALAQLKQLHQELINRIVCSGGGAKGIVYAGAYEAMKETGFLRGVEEVSGASAGAILAAGIAVGMPAAKLRGFLMNTNLSKLMGDPVEKETRQRGNGHAFFTKNGRPLEAWIRSSLADSVLNFLHKLKLPTNADKALRYHLEAELPFTFAHLAGLQGRYRHMFKKLIITAVRFPTGEVQVFDSTITPDVEIALACRASSSIPALLQPVAIEIPGKGIIKFVDGGLHDNLPTDYFDCKDETFVLNKKPERTVVFAFGDGSHKKDNHVFQSLHGPKGDGIIFRASWLQRFLRYLFVRLFGGFKAPYTNTKQKEASYQRLRQQYPLRTVELCTGDVGTMDFNKATRSARVMAALGYIDTMDYISHYELYDEKYNPQAFYDKVIDHFCLIYKAGLAANKKGSVENDKLLKKIGSMSKRSALSLIKERVGRALNSTEAFALSRAVECCTNKLSPETLFKETYLDAFKRSPIFSVSKVTKETIHRSSTLNTALTKDGSFFSKEPCNKNTRSWRVYNALHQSPITQMLPQPHLT